MKDQEFERLLKITRLRLSEEEKKSVKREIEEVIGYFDRIDAIKTHEPPAYQPVEIPGRLRKDEVIPFDDVEGLKRQSKLHNGYIQGPKL